MALTFSRYLCCLCLTPSAGADIKLGEEQKVEDVSRDLDVSALQRGSRGRSRSRLMTSGSFVLAANRAGNDELEEEE